MNIASACPYEVVVNAEIIVKPRNHNISSYWFIFYEINYKLIRIRFVIEWSTILRAGCARLGAENSYEFNIKLQSLENKVLQK